MSSVCDRKRQGAGLGALGCILLAMCGCGEPETARSVPHTVSPQFSPLQQREAHDLGLPVTFVNALGMRFVLIPAGAFTMGAPRSEPGGRAEIQHQVELSSAIYVQCTETTNAQFRTFRPSHVSSPFRGHDMDGPTQPVVHVNWEDAHAFASWLARTDPDREYRLPTEAEWEYACRAGTESCCWWGNASPKHNMENVQDERCPGSDFGVGVLHFDDGHAVSAPVGSFMANPWGLYDVLGNVTEWCADWYAPYSGVSVVDPQGPAGRARSAKVVRGGSWCSTVLGVRSASRGWLSPDTGYAHVGFRLVSPVPARGAR